MKNIKLVLFAVIATMLLYACSPAEGDFSGSEYMPDMGHSIAVEANVYTYYYYNTWDSASTIKLKDLTRFGAPVEGTVPRGYAGIGLTDAAKHTAMMKTLKGQDRINSIPVPVNSNVPYYYEDSDTGRLQAAAEIIANPFPITEEGLARGKELYNTFCGICHGEKGDGLGYLVAEENPNAIYPAAPANFLVDPHVNATNGHYYHAIIYGKNVMGGYADKVSYEERWQIIHYIRSLQAKDKKLAYNEEENTLNPALGTPMSQYVAAAGAHDSDSHSDAAGEGHNGGDHHGEEGHGEEHHDGGHDSDHGHDGHHE